MSDLTSIFTGSAGLVNLLLRAFGETGVFKLALDSQTNEPRRYQEIELLVATYPEDRRVATAAGAVGAAPLCARARAVVAGNALDRAPIPDRDRVVLHGVEFSVVGVVVARVAGGVACYLLDCARV